MTFARPYLNLPQVVVWLSNLDMACSANWRVHVYTTDITKTGFTLNLDTWADSSLYGARVVWLAHSPDNPHFASGSFSTADVRPWNKPGSQNSSKVIFYRPFGMLPRVAIALNGLDIDHQHNLRLVASASEVTNSDFMWHLDSWGDTVQYWSGGAYIAYA